MDVPAAMRQESRARLPVSDNRYNQGKKGIARKASTGAGCRNALTGSDMLNLHVASRVS